MAIWVKCKFKDKPKGCGIAIEKGDTRIMYDQMEQERESEPCIETRDHQAFFFCGSSPGAGWFYRYCLTCCKKFGWIW